MNPKSDDRADLIRPQSRVLRTWVRMAFVLLGMTLAWNAGTSGAEEISAEAGKELYQQFCLVCHGSRGQGSTLGPALTAAGVASAPDTDIARTITQGRTAQGMPMFGRSLERWEIQDVVAFVRTLQDASAEKKAAQKDEASPIDVSGGDARHGQDLFRGKANCAQCHTTFFTGGIIGPDLSDVARTRSQAAIYEAVTQPSKKVLRDYRGRRLVTRNGETIVGRYRNETPESVQILNREGNLWTTYQKSDLQSDDTLRDESLMPDNLLAPLSPDEVKDLFAYLYSLK